MSNMKFQERLLKEVLFRRDESWDRRNIIQPAFARVFSLVRKNCVDWIPFEEGCTIAEIGSGYGDFSDFLIDRSAHYYVYCQTEIASKIIKERYKKKFHSKVWGSQ